MADAMQEEFSRIQHEIQEAQATIRCLDIERKGATEAVQVQLLQRINTLQSRINTLQSRINTLEQLKLEHLKRQPVPAAATPTNQDADFNELLSNLQDIRDQLKPYSRAVQPTQTLYTRLFGDTRLFGGSTKKVQ